MPVGSTGFCVEHRAEDGRWQDHSKNPRYLQIRQVLVQPLDAHLTYNDPSASSVAFPMAEAAARAGHRGFCRAAGTTPLKRVCGRLPSSIRFISSICRTFSGIHLLAHRQDRPPPRCAGSEGAMTKGPFNALPPIIDLNAALVGYMLIGQPVFITAAGHVGAERPASITTSASLFQRSGHA
jgi:hypothetical protein